MAMEQEMLQNPDRASGSPCDLPLQKKVENDKER